MNKIVVCIMGQNCDDFLKICLESVKKADAIVYCDGGTEENSSTKIAEEYTNNIIQNPFDQNDRLMNGKQRNFYLEYLKNKYHGWWCLALDADEVLEDEGIEKLKEWIAVYDYDTSDIHHPLICNPRMRHLVQDFSHEDSTVKNHYVPGRFFQVDDDLEYPLGEHVVLKSRRDFSMINIDEVTVWHLAYAPLFHIRKRYEKNIKHSNVHSKSFLDQWYKAHLFGKYPKKEFNPTELPKTLLEAFHIDPEELYFSGRSIELKHFIDAIHWKNYFKPRSVLEVGAGLGPRVFALEQIGLKAKGYEISEYAVKHSLTDRIELFDITKNHVNYWERADLIIAYDVLEHIDYDDLDKVLFCLNNACLKDLLVSVPVIGDPNLEADKTHKIKGTRDWWVKKICEAGFVEKPVPDHFLFRDQLMIFEVKKV